VNVLAICGSRPVHASQLDGAVAITVYDVAGGF
jgi:hypothetical protein